MTAGMLRATQEISWQTYYRTFFLPGAPSAYQSSGYTARGVKHPFSRATDRGDLKCANVCNRAKKQAGVSEGKMIKKIIWGGGGGGANRNHSKNEWAGEQVSTGDESLWCGSVSKRKAKYCRNLEAVHDVCDAVLAPVSNMHYVQNIWCIMTANMYNKPSGKPWCHLRCLNAAVKQMEKCHSVW